jgi:phytoene synthase
MHPGHPYPRRPTKRPRDENFPVAALVLSRVHREAVLAFYRFVRSADDIADADTLTPDEKKASLDELETALLSGSVVIPEAADLHRIDATFGAGITQARQLLAAFRQDVEKTRYESWSELLDYCGLSANPVGRFLLHLHGEDEATHAPADALCTALQILNHLQDLAEDKARLDRVYLPRTWIERGGGAGFFRPVPRQDRRAVLDSALDRVDALIDEARMLPERIVDRRLRIQCRMTLAAADRLCARLRRSDPILARVELSRTDVPAVFLRGCLARRAGRDEAVTAAAVRRSRSSFRLGMRKLSAERRRAIHALYAFCRSVDDIADGAAPPAEKRRFLDGWRREIDRLAHAPQTPVGRELGWAARAFELPVAECHALLDGMETDSADRVRMNGDADLDLYCRRVAGSVGSLSIRIFGAAQAQDFALDLGRTLQIVNILRDVDEDAALDRIYVPLSQLARTGLQDAPAAFLVRDPRFATACQTLAAEARHGFARADEALKTLDRSALGPAILMMEGYRRLLDRLQSRGWGERKGKLRFTVVDRLQLLTLAMRTA